MRPKLRMEPVNGVELAVWEWPGNEPAILFVHATGFHGRVWGEVIQALPGRRALAVDLRGHGRSGKPAPPYRWPDFGRDVAELAERLGLRDVAGVAHSMGGHALAVAAALRPDTFASLLLIDPVIFTPEIYGRTTRADAGYIAKRRREWSSAEEMYERFRRRAPFASWRPEVLRDYCEYGLLPDGERWTLACPPEIEAAIYMGSNAREADVHGMLAKVEAPVTVVRAGIPWNEEKFDLAASPTDPKLASYFRDGRDVLLEGRSHYIPMESPHWVAERIIKPSAC